MSRCGFCDTSVTRKQGVFCSGPCKNAYHLNCVNIPSELVSFLSSVPGLQWKCSTCRVLDNKLEDKKLHDLFENKCTQLFNNFAAKFDDMKNEFMTSVFNKISDIAVRNVTSQATYADKLCQGLSEKIAVKPKNPKQENSRTKSDLMQIADPINLNVKINSVKHIKNGGILLDCKKSEETVKLKDIVEEKLSSNYEIHTLKSLHPHVRIVGISECMDTSTLLQYIRKQNEDIFKPSSECTIVRTWPTKKNKNILQATLQVDMSTYRNILNQGHLLVGLDSCAVYDAIQVPRCFKCNHYFHTKKTCKNNVTCPICAKNHALENCPAGSEHECINCLNLKEKQNIDVNTKHAVWDYDNCFAHKKATERFKFDLFGPPNK